MGNNNINDTFPACLVSLGESDSYEVEQVPRLKQNYFCFPMLRIFDLSPNNFSCLLLSKVYESWRMMIPDDTNMKNIFKLCNEIG